ncbi:MAG TPA: hypothetical protein VIC29_12190 [Steroidobacteraceae bacterium]|jgi:hypothetical protein
MKPAKSVSRLRRIATGTILYGVAAALFALSVALLLICLAGAGLLVMGVLSWARPGNVAAAWARTLAGLGLIGGSGGIWALGRLGVEGLVGPLGQRQIAMRRRRKFIAVIGILLALICLPFAAAIHASAQASWLAWGCCSGGA